MKNKGSLYAILPATFLITLGFWGCASGGGEKEKRDSDSLRRSIIVADSLDSVRAAFFADSIAQADSIARADSLREDSIRRIGENISMIRKLYSEYVLVEKGAIDGFIKSSISSAVLERMRRSHSENVGGPGYDFSIFRTGATDEPRGGSRVEKIEALKKNWYHVSYVDRGYPGAAKLQIDTLGVVVDVR